jgi:hypothetical protein
VQQGGQVDDRRIVVAPVQRKGQGEAAGAVGPVQHRLQAGQGLGLTFQVHVHRGLRAEGGEEGRDAGQHQGLAQGFGVVVAPVPLHGGGVGQHLERHQRVAHQLVGQHPRVHVVLHLAQFLQHGRGVRQHGDLDQLEIAHPAAQIGRIAGRGRG